MDYFESDNNVERLVNCGVLCGNYELWQVLIEIYRHYNNFSVYSLHFAHLISLLIVAFYGYGPTISSLVARTLAFKDRLVDNVRPNPLIGGLVIAMGPKGSSYYIYIYNIYI